MLLHAERGVKVRRGLFLARGALVALVPAPRPCPPLIARVLETRALDGRTVDWGAESGEPYRQAGLETGGNVLRTNLASFARSGVVPRRRGSVCLSPRPKTLFFHNQDRPRHPEGSPDVQIFSSRARSRAPREALLRACRPNTITKMATEVTEREC